MDVFGAKSEENGKVSKIKLEIVPDGVTLWQKGGYEVYTRCARMIFGIKE